MSNKKLDDFFNLPPMQEETESEITKVPGITEEELIIEADSIYSTLTMAQKVNHALTTVAGLDQHDSEMDAIASKADKAFKDLIALGGNVADAHAGKIFEVAGQMLKTSLDAKNAKADKKLKMVELQLRKVRADQIDFELGAGPSHGINAGEFDRSELIRYIVDSKKIENSDK